MMKDEQYLVSEGELKELYDNQDWAVIPDNSENDFKDFLKSKKPVDTLDRDKVEKIMEIANRIIDENYYARTVNLEEFAEKFVKELSQLQLSNQGSKGDKNDGQW